MRYKTEPPLKPVVDISLLYLSDVLSSVAIHLSAPYIWRRHNKCLKRWFTSWHFSSIWTCSIHATYKTKTNQESIIITWSLDIHRNKVVIIIRVNFYLCKNFLENKLNVNSDIYHRFELSKQPLIKMQDKYVCPCGPTLS